MDIFVWIGHPGTRLYCCFQSVFQLGARARWRRGPLVPSPKASDRAQYTNWRPITLLSCLGKLFERLLLPRLSRKLSPVLADCQAGFRYGADEQAWLLVESLRLRQRLPQSRRRALVAFVDIRKAYDTVWSICSVNSLISMACKPSWDVPRACTACEVKRRLF